MPTYSRGSSCTRGLSSTAASTTTPRGSALAQTTTCGGLSVFPVPAYPAPLLRIGFGSWVGDVEIERLLFRNFTWLMFYIFTRASFSEISCALCFTYLLLLNRLKQFQSMNQSKQQQWVRGLGVLGGALDAAGLRNGFRGGRPAWQ
jgi:hypothetical protein